MLICRGYYSADVAPTRCNPAAMFSALCPPPCAPYNRFLHFCSVLFSAGTPQSTRLGVEFSRERRSRVCVRGIRRNISADCLSSLYLLRANESNGWARVEAERERRIRGSTAERGGRRTEDAYALFSFSWANTDQRVSRGFTKGFPIHIYIYIYILLSTVSRPESEKTTASNAFHYCAA